jgi:hypothetical protein
MPTTRGYIGQRGGNVVIQLSRPGYDVLTAPAAGLVFNSAAKLLSPLVTGVVLNRPTGATNVALPKTFNGLPLIFVDRWVGADATRARGAGLRSPAPI